MTLGVARLSSFVSGALVLALCSQVAEAAPGPRNLYVSQAGAIHNQTLACILDQQPQSFDEVIEAAVYDCGADLGMSVAEAKRTLPPLLDVAVARAEALSLSTRPGGGSWGDPCGCIPEMITLPFSRPCRDRWSDLQGSFLGQLDAIVGLEPEAQGGALAALARNANATLGFSEGDRRVLDVIDLARASQGFWREYSATALDRGGDGGPELDAMGAINWGNVWSADYVGFELTLNPEVAAAFSGGAILYGLLS